MRSMTSLLCFGLMITCFASALSAAPDEWDPRLNQICGLYVEDVSSTVPAGNYYWRLISGVFQDEVEAGGTHHVYYKCLNSAGNPIEGQKTWQSWWYTDETGFASQDTKGALDGYWANAGMYANCPADNCGWPYNAWIDTANGPSDKVWGMGMHNPNGTPCGAHVSFLLTWQWTQAGPPPQPEISRLPVSFSRPVTQGENLGNSVFEVWNSGGGTLEYTISDNAGWISQTPSEGSSTGEHDNITIIYNVSGLGLGSHNATIWISDPSADPPSQTVTVTVTVEPPTIPGDFDGDSDVDQVDFGYFQACFTGEGYPQEDPACSPALLDIDLDVDQDDFAIFQGCISGPGVTGDPNCASD